MLSCTLKFVAFLIDRKGLAWHNKQHQSGEYLDSKAISSSGKRAAVFRYRDQPRRRLSLFQLRTRHRVVTALLLISASVTLHQFKWLTRWSHVCAVIYAELLGLAFPVDCSKLSFSGQRQMSIPKVVSNFQNHQCTGNLSVVHESKFFDECVSASWEINKR